MKVETLQEFVRKGQAAQQAIDKLLGEPKHWATEDLLYRYHNDARFHAFVERIAQEALAAYKAHQTK